MSIVKVTLPLGEIPVNGKQVSFVAPCNCKSVTGLSIEGETYTIVDALGEVISGTGNYFCAGSVVSVILNVDTKKAYLQNGVISPKVGDTLTTIRTDLGDKWLLCNGESVSAAEYPELCNTLAWSPVHGDVTEIADFSGYSVLAYKYLNGYHLYVLHKSNTLYIAYSQSFDGVWTINAVRSNSRSCSGVDIAYGNGYYVISCSMDHNYDSYPGVFVLYSTSLDGSWSLNQLVADSESAYGTTACYGHGYWCVQCSGKVYYATSLSGAWTSKNVAKSNNGGYRLSFVCDYFVFTETDLGSAVIYYTQNPSANWTAKYFGVEYSSDQGSVGFIGEVNGEIVIVSSEYDTYGYVGYRYRLLTGNSLDGTFTKKTIATPYVGIVYQNGVYIGFTGQALHMSADLFTTITDDSGGEISGIGFDEMNIILGSLFLAGKTNKFFKSDGYSVPVVSIDGAYTYIKAKE